MKILDEIDAQNPFVEIFGPVYKSFHQTCSVSKALYLSSEIKL